MMKLRALAFALTALCLFSPPLEAKEAVPSIRLLVDEDPQTGAVSTPTLAPAAPAVDAPLAWPLPTSVEAARVDGEDGVLAYPVYVPASDLGSLRRFNVTYHASFSVMPEASWLTLRINGKPAGRAPIAAPRNFRTQSFDLLPGAVTAGWNLVEIAVTQRHRVDCSLEATTELWTSIDPRRSGFVDRVPTIQGPEEIGAIGTDETGATRIHLDIPSMGGASDVARAVKAAEAVALRGHFLHPVVDAEPGSSGLNLMVATAGLISQLGDPDLVASSAPVRVVAKPGKAPMLIISASTEEDLERAITDFAEGANSPQGSVEGVNALRALAGLRLTPSKPVTLSEAGIGSAAFSGRLFRRAFNVILPSDAYLADYDEARLYFDGGYSAGLTEDAVLLVRVNGVVDGSLKFSQPGGEVLHQSVLHMPMAAFRPGLNQVEIEAQLPAQSDAACDTLTAIGARERFLMLGSTTLTLPNVARMAEFPGLSASFSNGFNITGGSPPQVYVPHASNDNVSAVATLLANAAVRSGEVTGARLALRQPQLGPAPVIVVGTVRDLPQQLLAGSGIDSSAARSAWQSATGIPKSDATFAIPQTTGALPGDVARLNDFNRNIESSHDWIGRISDLTESARKVGIETMRMAGLLPKPDEIITPTLATSLVIAQGQYGETPLTLVTAPDDASMAASMEKLTGERDILSLRGRGVSLAAGEEQATVYTVNQSTFYETVPLGLSNMRLFAAGWLSTHAGWYIGGALAVLLLLSGSTFHLLKLTRSDREEE